MLGGSGYLDRMTGRLGDLENEIAALAPTVAAEHEQALRDVQAALVAAKERLQTLRRAGAELTDEMAQSFTQSFERLQNSVGRLRAALIARHRPQDAAEAHWVEELVFTAWRQQQLRALEAAVLERAMASGTGAEASNLPSLATVIRYRARLDRDWRRAGEALHELRRARERLLPRARTHTAAELLAQAARMSEPGVAANAPHGPDAPRHAVPGLDELDDLDGFGMNEPPLNRHERRRLAALARAAGRHAA